MQPRKLTAIAYNIDKNNMCSNWAPTKISAVAIASILIYVCVSCEEGKGDTTCLLKPIHIPPMMYQDLYISHGHVVTFYDCQCNSCSGVLFSFRHVATIQLARKVCQTLGLPNCFSFFMAGKYRLLDMKQIKFSRISLDGCI